MVRRAVLAGGFRRGVALHSWALSLVAVSTIAACSGGGCGSGCMQPIAGGYPAGETVDKAAAMRITRSGLDFLGANAPTLAETFLGTTGGVYSVEIPKTSTTVDIPVLGSQALEVCLTGSSTTTNPPRCYVDLKLKDLKLRIDAISPSNIRLKGTVPIRLRDLPMKLQALGEFRVGLGSGSCSGQTPNYDYKTVSLSIELPAVAETLSPRSGFTKIDTKAAQIDIGLSQDDIGICKDCGFFTSVCNGIYAAIKNAAFNSIKSSVVGKVRDALGDALCQSPNPLITPNCPTGSSPDTPDPATAKRCLFDSDRGKCVPSLLGVEGKLSVGDLLAGVLPGSQGSVDMQFAAGGALDPSPGEALVNDKTNNGITLSMRGGLRASPQNACVPKVDNPMPTGIPVPKALRADKVSPWPTGETGPHVGLALSERFLNYAFTGLYNGGSLCLGISTEQTTMLHSGLLSLLVPSLKRLTYEQQKAPVAVVTRPQRAPIVELGGGTDPNKDPLLKLTLSRFAVDFYVQSYGRFIRAFTFTADVTMPVTLQTGKDPVKNPNGGLLPVLGNLDVKNAQVSNSDLLLEEPAAIATGFAGLLTELLGTFLADGLSPFDVSGALKSQGLMLSIPDGSIRKITDTEEDFLALFANLSVAQKVSLSGTRASIRTRELHPEAMSLETARRDQFPKLIVSASSTLQDASTWNGAVEYTWWIDRGTHAAWSRNGTIVVDNDTMIMQGRHTLYVSSRVVGQPASEGAPAEVPFVIDTTPPQAELVATVDGLRLRAFDYVTTDANLTMRYAKQDQAFSEWERFTELTFRNDDGLTVEVRDEEGNVGRTSSALIRGRKDGTLDASTSACSMTAGGAGQTPGGAGWLCVGGVFGLLGFLRRRVVSGQRLTTLAAGAIAVGGASMQGCSCSSDIDANVKTGCGPSCNDECGGANTIGIVGAYTSIARGNDGSVWVAGYNDVDKNGSNVWGDLVAGKFDSGKKLVNWSTVDGLPAARTDGTCPANDPRGWRGGETDLGANVGLYSSIQVGDIGEPMIAYYDATTRSLKFAIYDGKSWSSYFIKEGTTDGDYGRFAKLVIVNGLPTAVFFGIEKGAKGKARSKVMLATAQVSSPHSSSDWTFEDVALDEASPCRAVDCDGGQLCIQESSTCQATVIGCTPECKAGGFGAASACVMLKDVATCGTVVDPDFLNVYPQGLGIFISAAVGPKGLGIVAYDRIRGNLLMLQKSGAKWTSAIVDGETGLRSDNSAVDTGDVGVGASLAIDSKNNWHISYVNGSRESLQYVKVEDGKKVLAPERIDDGSSLGGKAFADGVHVIGDDSSLTAESSGAVTVLYQDATVGTLRIATGVPKSDGTHQWTVLAVDQPGKFAGFFPQRVTGTSLVANFWRSTDRPAQEFAGDVAIFEP